MDELLQLVKAMAPFLAILGTLLGGYSTFRLRKLQADLDRKLFVHQKQFEREFITYSQIWPKLYQISRAMHELREVAGQRDTIKAQGGKERLSTAIITYSESIEAFRAEFDEHRPFYSEKVNAVLEKVYALLNKERIAAFEREIDVEYNYWDDVKGNYLEFIQLREKCCRLIRKRVGTLKT